jgi:hypothetical protein
MDSWALPPEINCAACIPGPVAVNAGCCCSSLCRRVCCGGMAGATAFRGAPRLWL